MSAFRQETDSLGTVQLPADALWGAQTQRAIENFPISGLKPYPAFIWSMAIIKRAAVEVNADLGLFTDTEANGQTISADAIAQTIMLAADEIISGQHHDQFVVDPIQAGAGTSHNMNTNEVIANLANRYLGHELTDPHKPIHPNDHVNMAQSTNDTIPTAIRLGCLWRLDELLDAMGTLSTALRVKADDFDTIVKSGRTHLQDAVPIRLGQEFSGYALSVERNMDKISHAAESLRRLGIGGTAAGTGLNAHPEYHGRMITTLSRLTNLTLYESDNLFESMQSMADPVYFSGALRTFAQDMTRIANDFRLLASGPTTGLDELRLPAVQPGSSIMPGKVNPVMAEMLNMTMFQIMGNDTTILMAAQAGQLELNVMMPIIAYNLFQSIDILINSIKAFTSKCVLGLQANPEKAAGWLAKNAILVTALNPLIGYAKGAEVAKEALASNRTVREVALEKGYLTAEQADQLLNTHNMTEGGLQ